MKVAVLGSGNGGCAVAYDFAAHGREVSLYDLEAFPENIAAVGRQGGIHAEGDIAPAGFAPIAYAGHDAGRALNGAELVLAVGPAYSTTPLAQACRPYLREGQVVIVCPGSCGGAVEFKKAANLPLRDRGVIVAETHTLPYAVRLMSPGRVRVFLKLKAGVFISALPARDTRRALDLVRDVYPCLTPARNILQTGLQNANPIIHPAVTLLNAARIERTRGDFLFYEEGVTPAVGRLIEALDRERIAIGRQLGLDLVPDPKISLAQGYMAESTYDVGYSTAPGFKGIKAQSSLDHRYFNEDVGHGLVFLHDLGLQVGVATPCIDAVVRLASCLMRRDYLGEARRTMASLGLCGRSADELTALLE
ncbi:MAG: NAD/NADP octopine/nopaline dehydrogenase family protein [Phycisphaerae bacterium]